MKEVMCNKCNKKWSVDNENLYKLKFCPYCGTDSPKKLLITVTDKYGENPLNEMERLKLLMFDLAPNLKHDILAQPWSTN